MTKLQTFPIFKFCWAFYPGLYFIWYLILFNVNCCLCHSYPLVITEHLEILNPYNSSRDLLTERIMPESVELKDHSMKLKVKEKCKKCELTNSVVSELKTVTVHNESHKFDKTLNTQWRTSELKCVEVIWHIFHQKDKNYYQIAIKGSGFRHNYDETVIALICLAVTEITNSFKKNKALAQTVDPSWIFQKLRKVVDKLFAWVDVIS